MTKPTEEKKTPKAGSLRDKYADCPANAQIPSNNVQILQAEVDRIAKQGAAPCYPNDPRFDFNG